MNWFLGQSRNQALHAIDSILALEKSLMLLNEKIRSLKLQLMGNAVFDPTDGTNVLQQLDDSHAQHVRITDSLRHK